MLASAADRHLTVDASLDDKLTLCICPVPDDRLMS